MPPSLCCGAHCKTGMSCVLSFHQPSVLCFGGAQCLVLEALGSFTQELFSVEAALSPLPPQTSLGAGALCAALRAVPCSSVMYFLSWRSSTAHFFQYFLISHTFWGGSQWALGSAAGTRGPGFPLADCPGGGTRCHGCAAPRQSQKRFVKVKVLLKQSVLAVPRCCGMEELQGPCPAASQHQLLPGKGSSK